MWKERNKKTGFERGIETGYLLAPPCLRAFPSVLKALAGWRLISGIRIQVAETASKIPGDKTADRSGGLPEAQIAPLGRLSQLWESLHNLCLAQPSENQSSIGTGFHGV